MINRCMGAGWMHAYMHTCQMNEQMMDDGWITDDEQLDTEMLAGQMDSQWDTSLHAELMMDDRWMDGR